MKILHLANWNSTNIGNGALIYGTQRLLSEDIPNLEFVPEAWDDYTFKSKHFDETFVDKVNAHAALLVNGAVTMNAFRRNTKHTGMRFNLPLKLWADIKKPIIFYGISYRCWPFQDYPNKEALAASITYALSQDHIFFGVRNDGTKEWIRDRLGIESEKIREIPDPGMFVPYEDHAYPELHPTRKNVILVVNNEDAVYRFASAIDTFVLSIAQRIIDPTRAERVLRMFGFYKSVRARVVRELVVAAEKIAAKHDVQFILAPHYLDDYDMLDEVINRIQERIAHQRIVSTGLLSVPNTAYFYGRYKKADLAISMRVHSMSPSIGLGIPVIPVTSQGRMRNYLRKAGLSAIGIDIASSSFGTALAERASELLTNPAPLLKVTKEATHNLREQARSENVRVEKLLKRTS